LTGLDLNDPIDHHPIPPSPEPLTALAQQFGRSRAEQAAICALPELADLGDPAAARAAWCELDLLTTRLANHQQPEGGSRDTPASSISKGSRTERQRRRDQSRLRVLEGQLQYRERLFGVDVRYERPDWAAKLLGPLPTSRTGEAAWLKAAGAVAAYIERWDGANNSHRPATSAAAQQRHANRVAGALQGLRRCTLTFPLTAEGSWQELAQPLSVSHRKRDPAARNVT
jgi:hypothetical protein